MTTPARAWIPATLAALLLGACASQTDGIQLPTASITPPSPAVPAETVTRLPSRGGYQLTAEELDLDCRKLTGRMAVRIVQIRDFQSRVLTTSLSRGLQSAARPAFGGSGEGSDPEGRYARDRAMLEAYNQRLADQNCANFDLDAELAPGATDPPRTRPLRRS
ncbi:hypothetical protein [Hyphomicrobium sp.]|uniref:hypothetical protein n=1 Tax=Hyphomicrobium sp. TaxID=82 RepID=UPI002FDDD934